MKFFLGIKNVVNFQDFFSSRGGLFEVTVPSCMLSIWDAWCAGQPLMEDSELLPSVCESPKYRTWMIPC